MAEIDAKVNMSLDEIIKMENKKKRRQKVAGFRGNANERLQHGRNTARKNAPARKRQGKVQGGFVKKRNDLFKAKNNANLNRGLQRNNVNNSRQGNFKARNLNNKRAGLVRSKSRSNLNFAQNNRFSGKRTNSMPNLGDPNSVHNRLGYQTPAQIAYRKRVKLAKAVQLLFQNQKFNIQSKLRANQRATPLTTFQRALELRQQALLPQRGYGSGLRSDLILRAQRRAQYEDKLMRIKAAQRNNNQDVKVIYPTAQRSLSSLFSSLNPQNSVNLNTLQQLSSERSSYRQGLQTMQQNQAFNHQRRGNNSRYIKAQLRNFTNNEYMASQRTNNEDIKVIYPATQRSLNSLFSRLNPHNSINVNTLQQLSRERSPFSQGLQSMQQRTQLYEHPKHSNDYARNIMIQVHGRSQDAMLRLPLRGGVTSKTLNERFNFQ